MRVIVPVLFFMLSILLHAEEVFAVHLFLDTETNVHSTSDVFYVPVRIDTQEECINAISVAISYDPSYLAVEDISIGDSVITLWTKEPTIERGETGEIGRVLLEGGIPGGFCGRVTGDPGQTNSIAKLVVSGVGQVSQDEERKTQLIVEPGTAVYLHDGTGSLASTTLQGLELTFTNSTSTAENLWLGDVKSDSIAPELFDIVFVEGPSVGNQRHYIVFNTVDKQSGIDHYEVLETDPDRFGFLTWVSRESYWVTATSPYVLRDQNLHSKILVKAVDKNGNERIASYTPNMSPLTELTQPRVLLPLGVALFVLLLLVYLSIVLLRKKKKVQGDQIESQYE